MLLNVDIYKNAPIYIYIYTHTYMYIYIYIYIRSCVGRHTKVDYEVDHGCAASRGYAFAHACYGPIMFVNSCMTRYTHVCISKHICTCPYAGTGAGTIYIQMCGFEYIFASTHSQDEDKVSRSCDAASTQVWHMVS